ncbi:MAG: hypothetical protein JNJ83_02035 [Verrucomicrobiaceae bacterium]|nr:hypothetical protein [Verrucomicrobiaceae bacterium]
MYDLLPYLTALPGLFIIVLGCLWLVGVNLPESALTRSTKLLYALLSLGFGWLMFEANSFEVDLGSWFEIGSYHYPITLVADKLSIPFAFMTVVLAGITGTFSQRYLHRDPGFFRFFLLLHVFAQGALIIFLAGSLDLLVAGWELVGISSVLLVGFFQYRRDPIRNALRVFATYRVADVNILMAILLLHCWYHTASWDDLVRGVWPNLSPAIQDSGITIISILLVLAASGKASQGPFGGWLARAMEGPTPSSAVFYGAISIHAGAYLLLRAAPLILSSTLAQAVLIFIGAGTAIVGTLVHRTCTDAKTSIAYAAQTQLGIIFVEIGLGWTTFAVWHIIGHALLRMMQFLRAPSLLHDHHKLHAAAGGHLASTGAHYERLLPPSIQLWLYRIALARGFYDAAIDRFIVAPIQAIGRVLAVSERTSK